VEIVEGSHGEADVVNRAFQGADAVFWLVPANPRAESSHAAYVDFSRPACEAFKTHGVRRIVDISSFGRGWPKEAGPISASLAMDDMIAKTGVALRSLTCGTFMDNVLRQAESIRGKGVFYGVTPGDFKLPMCCTRDIAAVAAALLRDSSWSGINEVPILGPEEISFNQIGDVITEVIGRTVRYQEIPMDAFKTMLSARISEGMAQSMVNMMIAANEGIYRCGSRSNAANSPTTFRYWCEAVLKPAVQG
jgi:uncharacterized protein YbjT (DUF2867 family)